MNIEPKRLLIYTMIVLSTIGETGCSATKASSDVESSSGGRVSNLRDKPPKSGAGLSGLDGDKDNDSQGQGPPHDADSDAVLTFGHVASVTDRQAITTLIERYYVAAAEGDGTKACLMLYFLVEELVVEEHHRGKGLRSLRGETCSQIMSKIFSQLHSELVEDALAPKTAVVRVSSNRGVAVVRFGAIRELRLVVQRESGGWKMDAPLDVGSP